jgi:hypothetical protein
MPSPRISQSTTQPNAAQEFQACQNEKALLTSKPAKYIFAAALVATAAALRFGISYAFPTAGAFIDTTLFSIPIPGGNPVNITRGESLLFAVGALAGLAKHKRVEHLDRRIEVLQNQTFARV